MNPRITDLLDNYVDTSVRLFPPEEVLHGTGSGTKKSPMPKPAQHRMKKPMVIAATLLLILTGITGIGLKIIGSSSSGSSLNTGVPDVPTTAQWDSPKSASSVEEFIPDDLVLDDTNSVIVTSEATGLSMRVPVEYQYGLETDQSITLTANAPQNDAETFCANGVFAFYDTSNQPLYDGLVFTIDAWDQVEFDSYLSDDFRNYTFALNNAVVGSQGSTYYSMLQFGTIADNIFRLFDHTSLDSAKEYYERLKYAIPMVKSFMELNHLESVETDLDAWDELFRQRTLEPMEQLIQELETAQTQSEPQEATQADTAVSEPDFSPADGLHSAQPAGKDTAFITLTSSTGLSLSITEACGDAGEFYVDDTISLQNFADGTSWDIDVVFAAFDQNNIDSGGFLWAIVSGTPAQLPMVLPSGYLCKTMGHLEDNAYSIVMPTSDVPQYDSSSYSSVISYLDHANAIYWNLNQLTSSLATSTEEQDWIEVYQAQVLDPNADCYAQLEQAHQNSLQPTDESLSLPTSEDKDGDGLLTAEPNISVETEYGTAILQAFTLDPSSGQFSWYTDLSGLPSPFTEYSSASDGAFENDEFQAAWLTVTDAIQRTISDSLLVYPDGSHLCLSTGELVSYENNIFRSYDTIGLTTEEPTSDENPSCIEIGGVTYRFT